MKAYTITPKGQVTIPAEIRAKMKVKPGDKIIYEDRTGGIFLRSAGRDLLADFGFLKGRRKSPDLEKMRKAVRKKMAKREF